MVSFQSLVHAVALAEPGPVGESDPIFNRDLGFFLFSLPFWETLQQWCFNLVLLTLVTVVLIYLVELGLSEQRLTLALSLYAQRHLLILGDPCFSFGLGAIGWIATSCSIPPAALCLGPVLPMCMQLCRPRP